MDIIQKIKKEAEGLRKRIIFPEATDKRILKAAEESARKKIIKAVLVGNENEIKSRAKSLGIDLAGIEIINPSKSSDLNKYALILSKKMTLLGLKPEVSSINKKC